MQIYEFSLASYPTLSYLAPDMKTKTVKKSITINEEVSDDAESYALEQDISYSKAISVLTKKGLETLPNHKYKKILDKAQKNG